jgi:hypothetical protein
MNNLLYELGGDYMFNKLDTQIKKNSVKGKALLTLKEKQELEKEIIFGNLLEDLNSIKIETAYEELSKEIDKNENKDS